MRYRLFNAWQRLDILLFQAGRDRPPLLTREVRPVFIGGKECYNSATTKSRFRHGK